MIGAPIGSQYGGCLWTAGGDMVCNSKEKMNYYFKNDESKKSTIKARRESFKEGVSVNSDSGSEDDDDNGSYTVMSMK
jgi:hypothetical protein